MSLSGFWRCCAIAALALLADGAFAQPPQEIIIPEQDTIVLQPGEARIFQFSESLKDIGVPGPKDSIVRITPQTDRTFVFEGVGSGETIVTARAPDGHIVLNMTVVVEGHLVKMYGSRDTNDYVGFVCTGTGCGRADPDAAAPGSVAVTTRRGLGNGDAQWTTKSYGPGASGPAPAPPPQ